MKNIRKNRSKPSIAGRCHLAPTVVPGKFRKYLPAAASLVYFQGKGRNNGTAGIAASNGNTYKSSASQTMRCFCKFICNNSGRRILLKGSAILNCYVTFLYSSPSNALFSSSQPSSTKRPSRIITYSCPLPSTAVSSPSSS